MMLSLTGLGWLWASIVSLIFVSQLRKGYKKGGATQPFFAAFGKFFFCMAVSFLFFTPPMYSLDNLFISEMLFYGHIPLWIGFAFLADVPWRLSWYKYINKWTPRMFVLLGGSVQLYLEATQRVDLPVAIPVGPTFSITAWGLPFSSLLAMMVTLWILSIPVGFIFLREAGKLKGKGKVRSIGIGSVFILSSIAGALSTYNQPASLLLIETFVSWLGFTILLVAILTETGER
jgi:hypothetical protein